MYGLSIYEIKRICHHAQFFIISMERSGHSTLGLLRWCDGFNSYFMPFRSIVKSVSIKFSEVPWTVWRVNSLTSIHVLQTGMK